MTRSWFNRSSRGIVLAALALAFAAGTAFAQTGRIEGTVRDANTGDPIPNARVTVLGTQLAGVTNQNGYYAIDNVPAGSYEVRVNVIGYQQVTITNQRVAAGLPTTTNFTLAQSILRIEGVVVTGVAEATEAVKLPFTVDQVSEEDLQVPAQTAEESIRGKVAGARIIRGEGTPGEGAVTVLLRGATSITTGNEPLFVVDGVILGADMVDIDALDIENIEVVKGAAAAALFGSRAANGVVSIKTRRGRDVPEGDTRITFRSEFGQNQIEHLVAQKQSHWYELSGTNWVGSNPLTGLDSLVSANDRALAQRGDWRVAFDSTTFSVTDWDADGVPDTGYYWVSDNPYPGRTFDNFEEFFDPGNFYTQSVNIAHRSGGTNFLASFHETKESGIIEAPTIEGYLRRGARINVDHSLGEDFDFSASAFYSTSTRDDPQGDENAFYGLQFYPIDVDLKELNPDPRDSVDFLIQPDPVIVESNPVYESHNADFQSSRSRVLGNFRLRWRPTDIVSLEADFSYDRSDVNNTNFFHKGYRSVDPSIVNEGLLSKSNNFSSAINGSVTAAVNESFGQFNTVTKARVLLERDRNEFFSARTARLAVDGVPDLDVGEQAENRVSSSQTEVRSLGYFLSTQLDYADRYIVDALIRRDGSSLFGSEERWNWYYRLSGAYRMAQESWWPIDFIDEFKLRASYGTAGNRPGFSSQYETFSVSGGQISKGTLGNRLLKPELAQEQEYGIDMILAGRISLGVTYAKTVTEEQILSVPLAGFFGFGSQVRNAGTLESKTWEGTLQAALIQQRSLGWNVNFVIDQTEQEITELGVPAYRTGPGAAFYIRQGEPFGRMWGHRWAATCSEIRTDRDGDGTFELPYGAGDNSCLVANGGAYQVNDDGYLVAVGTDRDYTEKLFSSTITLDGVDYNWGFPFYAYEEMENPITGQIDTSNFLPIGNTQPDFNFGIGNNFRVGGFTLYALFDAQIGGDIYNNTRQWAHRESNNWEVDQTDKDETLKKPISYYNTLYDVNAVNNHFVEDGTFVKFRELQLRYTFGRNQLENVLGGFVKRVSLSLTGRNLLTWTDYTGFDPEVSTSNSEAAVFRFDGFEYPNYRTITGAIEIEF